MITTIGISTRIYDLLGSVHLPRVDEVNSRASEHLRRMSRTATLDTGTYIDDRGYHSGDRTIDLSFAGTETLFQSLLYLVKNYGSLNIMLSDGAYIGNIQRLTRERGRVVLSLLIETDA